MLLHLWEVPILMEIYQFQQVARLSTFYTYILIEIYYNFYSGIKNFSKSFRTRIFEILTRIESLANFLFNLQQSDERKREKIKRRE